MDERGRESAGGAAVAVERDRVLDAARAFALLVVVLAHSLAWDLSTTSPMSVLDLRPDVAGATWTLQILPLFFAAGAVTNRGSWERHPEGFLPRRLVRLGVPALVYTAFWTVLGLPAALLVPGADLVGRFLAQLLWFLGVYAAVTAAVPWTVRWTARPVLSLGLWLGAIAAVDALRWNVHPTLGQLNLLLVWGFCHQAGYHLPSLRRAHPGVLLAGTLAAAGSAVGLAVWGPYSSSLVTYAADPEPSNLSPPTLVVALYGLGLVLGLAALWPALTRLFAHDSLYRLVGGFGMRAVGVYLWHIPIVALVVGAAWLAQFWEPPFTAAWWAVHLLGLAVVLPLAWLLAGMAARADRAVLGWLAHPRALPGPLARPRDAVGPLARPSAPRGATTTATVALAVALPLVLLAITTTGFGTWWGPGPLGVPTSSLLNMVLLVAILRGLARART